jgi:hypothetical protein
MCFVSYQGFAGGNSDKVIQEFTEAVVKNTVATTSNTEKIISAIENHKKNGNGDPPAEENKNLIDFTPEYLGMIMRSQSDFSNFSFFLSKEVNLKIIETIASNQQEFESKDGIFIVNSPIEADNKKIEDVVIGINSTGKLNSRPIENNNVLLIEFQEQKNRILKFRKNVHRNIFELFSIEITDNKKHEYSFIGSQPPYLRILGIDNNNKPIEVEVPASGAVTRNPAPRNRSLESGLPYEISYASHNDNTYSTPSRYIMGPRSLNRQNVITFVRTKNRVLNSGDITAIINKYFDEADYEGVNVDIAIAQMLHWTDYLKNKERVATRNYGGLSRIGNWNGRFPYHIPRDGMTEGVRAHIQHLKAYANEPLKRGIADPRYQLAVNRGFRGIRFDDVYRFWSENPNYGRNIENILNDLRSSRY